MWDTYSDTIDHDMMIAKRFSIVLMLMLHTYLIFYRKLSNKIIYNIMLCILMNLPSQLYRLPV